MGFAMDFSQFNKDSLLENIRINDVFFIKLLNTSGDVSSSFDDFYRSEYDEVLNALKIDAKANSDYKFSETSEFLEYIVDNDTDGVLLSFSTQIPTNFRFNDEGTLLSCSVSWGHYNCCVTHAQTLEDALHQAIKIQDELFNEYMTKAKEKAMLSKQPKEQ